MRYLAIASIVAAGLMLAGEAVAHTDGDAPHFQFADVQLDVPGTVTPLNNAAPESFGQKLLDFVSPSGLMTVLGLIISAIGGLTWFNDRRKRIIALAAYHAFHIVEDIGNEIDGDDAFDKTAEYLKQVDAYLVAHGWRPLKAGEGDAAKLQAQALHGVEVAKAKVAEAAAAVVLPSSSPS